MEAKKANALICPTPSIILLILRAPIRTPKKKAEAKYPIISGEKSSNEARIGTKVKKTRAPM